MDVKKLNDAIDKMVVSGKIIDAFDKFASTDCVTHSNPNDVTRSKAEKMDALRWFFSVVEKVNNIQLHNSVVVNHEESRSHYTFDFISKQGQPMVYNEVIRRVWNNGQLVEEQYLIGESLPVVEKVKKAKADASPAPAKVAAAPKAAKTPAAEKTVKAPAAKKETAAKAPVDKKVPAKADDLTLIEGVGPKIAELLQKAGMVTFADVAKAKPAAIKSILDAAGKRYQMHDPATWPKQAALARDGKTAELQKLQNELKGGK